MNQFSILLGARLGSKKIVADPVNRQFCFIQTCYPMRWWNLPPNFRAKTYGLGAQYLNFLGDVTNRPIFNMTPRKSQRLRKPRTIWEEKGAPFGALDPKILKNAARTVEKTALKPVATGPLPKAIGFDAAHLPELSTYKPPLDLQSQLSISLVIGLSHEWDKFLNRGYCVWCK
jgi:hypothetical protein